MGALGLVIIIVVRLLLASPGRQFGLPAIRPSLMAPALRLALLFTAFTVQTRGGSVWLSGALVLAAMPNLLIDGLLIPSGMPWLAFAATRALRPPGVGNENHAAAVFNELRARLRWGWRLDAESIRRLVGGLLLPTHQVDTARGATVATRAVLDVLRGDIEHARPLFELAMEMKHSPRNVRAYCQAWLLADAAKRGQYVELLRVSRRGPRTLRRWFLRLCSEQLLRQKRRAAPVLWLAWLAAPGRRQGLGLLRLALSQKPAPQLAELHADLAGARQAALRLVAQPGSATLEQVREAAELWESVLTSGTLRDWVEERVAASGSNIDVDSVVGRLEQSVLELLADSWRTSSPGSLDEPESELLRSAIDQVRSGLLDELEVLVGELQTGGRPSTGETEEHLRRWAAIRRLIQRYAELFPHDIDLFYDNLGTQVLNHGVWLTNRELRYSLGCDVFRFLSQLLHKTHDSQKLLKSNAKIAQRAAAAL